MSRTSARHRKPSRSSSSRTTRPGRHARPGRHKKRSAVRSSLLSRPAQIGVVAAAGAVAIAVPAAQGVLHLPGSGARTVSMSQVGGDVAAGMQDSLGGPSPAAAASRGPRVTPAPAPSSPAPATSATKQPAPQPVYLNPLRDVSGLIPERIDMGVDFGGSGPVYAIGDGVITSAASDSAGWPGGGWITYQLTDGPAAGLEVYVAEDVQPMVSVGQQVTPSTVIANMFNGGDGIETGWAQPGGTSAESQLAAAGGISGSGPFPTEVGLNFDALLQTLGVPAAPNAGQSGYGTLPSGYPATWSAALEP